MKILAFILGLGLSVSQASPFEYEYSAASGLMPQDASPEWRLRHGDRGNFQLRDERLVATTPAGDRNFFVIGTLDDGNTYGQPGVWDGSAKESTIEFRVRCESENPEQEIFSVHVSNGALQWRLRFYNDRVYPKGVSIEASEADTYRATIREGKLTLVSERKGVIFADVPGSETYAGKQTQSNAILFGSFSPNSKAEGGTSVWELDFIRWINQAALSDPNFQN